jgi:hypothetical protein
MSNLQKALQSLQPFLIGIRYLDSIPVVDAKFKEGWFVPDSKYIKKAKSEGESNHYIFYSETEGIGLDELLEFLQTTINANIEREKKIELLKIKVVELKEVFNNNPLFKLEHIKFCFDEQDLVPELNDLKISEEDFKPENKELEKTQPEKQIVEQFPKKEEEYADNPEMSDEEKEILAEDERAANFKKWKENNAKKTKASKIELPPKKIMAEVEAIDGNCNCGPEEACPKCIDKKDL